jgi:hypothetical protein
MSWTYSGNPTASQLDEVRFLIGDTVASMPWTLQDAEITYTLTKFPSSVLLAAAVAAESVLGKISGLANSKRIGDLSLDWGKRHEQFQMIARNLRSRAALEIVQSYVGGISKTEKDAVDSDADRVGPAVTVDGMTYPSKLTREDTLGV